MKKENITPDDQREVTRLCVQTALLLLQHGAESTVVAQMTQRLGLALGVESVECALTFLNFVRQAVMLQRFR